MAHICENDMIQIKDMFHRVATWLQLSTEEYCIKTTVYVVEIPHVKGPLRSLEQIITQKL